MSLRRAAALATSHLLPPAAVKHAAAAEPRQSIDSQLASLAGPALAAGLLIPLDEMMQAAMVGRLSGTAALAAMGVCSSVFLLVFKGFNFLETATTPRVARCAHDATQVSRVAANALFTALAIGVLIAVTIYIGATRLLDWLATQSELVPICLPYIRVRALGAPFELATMAALGTLRGCRDLTTPAAATLLSMALCNAVGLVLMAWYDMGLVGLAIGRVVASAATCAVLLSQLRAHGRLQWRHLRAFPPLQAYVGYARSAGALFARTMMIKLFFTTLGVHAGKLATAYAAAHVVLRQTASLFSIALDSYAVAAQALTATHLGRGQTAHVRAVGLRAHKSALLLSAVMAVCLYAFSSRFTNLFTDDAAVHAALTSLMPTFCALQLLAAPAYIFDGLFLGAADFGYMASSMGVAVGAGFAALYSLPWVMVVVGQAAGGGGGGGSDDTSGSSHALIVLWLAWGVHVSARSLCFARRFFAASSGPFAIEGGGCGQRGSGEEDETEEEEEEEDGDEEGEEEGDEFVRLTLSVDQVCAGAAGGEMRQRLHRACKLVRVASECVR